MAWLTLSQQVDARAASLMMNRSDMAKVSTCRDEFLYDRRALVALRIGVLAGKGGSTPPTPKGRSKVTRDRRPWTLQRRQRTTRISGSAWVDALGWSITLTSLPSLRSTTRRYDWPSSRIGRAAARSNVIRIRCESLAHSAILRIGWALRLTTAMLGRSGTLIVFMAVPRETMPP